jgi:hypothetical protein
MCFSATASFIVGGSLTVVGVATLAKATRRSDLPFAAIPFLFGIQQSVEGLLWLSLQHDMAMLRTVMTYLFTLFSHLIWPAFVPFAIARMEEGLPQKIEPWRKNTMWGFRAIGALVAMSLLALVATQPLTAVVNVHIIYVTPFFYDWPMMVLYIAATCIVALFSRHPLIRLFGLTVFAFFFVSWWFYTEAFFSVWCFFAAILSGIIYLHFRRPR